MTFDAKDDAIAWLSVRRAAIQMGVWAPAAAACAASRRQVPTLREYGDTWLENRRTRGREVRPTTRQQCRMILDTCRYPTFGDEPMDLISADDVNGAAHRCLSADCRPCAETCPRHANGYASQLVTHVH